MHSPSSWTPPPRPLTLEPGWVHLFRLTLDLPDADLAELRAVLDPDEQARADRFVRERDRRHFTAARGQMRVILAATTGQSAESLQFTYNPQGKPSLAVGEPRFNLSHSAGLGLLAVALGREVGVDVEEMQREIDYTNIARRFFAPSEAAALLALPAEAQRQGFFNCWTRKEAYIKARGMGLSIPLDSFTVSLAPGDPPRLTAPDPGWSLHVIDLQAGFAGALVVQGEITGIKGWVWSGL